MMQNWLGYVLLASFLLGGNSAQAQAASQERCFEQTGYCISGTIRAYWERHGGLAVFGYPISGLQQETNNDGWNGPTQWFERDRLEDHGSDGVLAGRLGAFALELQSRPWQSFTQVSGAAEGCRFFPQTGHSLCEPFLSYWEKNGGLERFGYPITEPTSELYIDTSYTSTRRPYTVQYFERRRMEHHEEYVNTQYEVLLGLLGTNISRYGGCTPADAPLAESAGQLKVRGYIGCPSWSFPPRYLSVGVWQPFERGTMIWVEGGYRTPSKIYVVFYDSVKTSYTWQQYDDVWAEGMPDSTGETPPTGLYAPHRGFGKVWMDYAAVRNTLGWATMPEVGINAPYQEFVGGGVMVQYQADKVFLLLPDGKAMAIAL